MIPKQISDCISREEYERRHRQLWVGWIVCFVLICLGTFSLAIGLRSEGIDRREAQAEQDRESQLAICKNQNDLREQIRNFVIALSDNPNTEEAVAKVFGNVNCEELVK